MKKYELLYIVSSEYTDEEVKKIQADVAGVLEKVGAKVSRDEVLGKIRLAYPIKKRAHGSYVLVHFDADGTVLPELDQLLRLKDEVLRHMVVDLPAGAEKRAYELTSYVPPLSEEAQEQKRASRETKRESAEAAAPRKEEPKEAPASTPKETAPAAKSAETKPADAETSKMSMDELDKKLDAILDEDVK